MDDAGGYCDLLDTIEREQLVDHVAPIQLAIRLLIPQGSRLLELDEVRQAAGAFDPKTLTYPLDRIADPRVDRAARRGRGARRQPADGRSRRQVFDEISDLRARARRHSAAVSVPLLDRAAVPYLNEPWYC